MNFDSHGKVSSRRSVTNVAALSSFNVDSMTSLEAGIETLKIIDSKCSCLPDVLLSLPLSWQVYHHVLYLSHES